MNKKNKKPKLTMKWNIKLSIMLTQLCIILSAIYILHVFYILRVYNAFEAINGLEFSVCIVIEVFVLVGANVLAHW